MRRYCVYKLVGYESSAYSYYSSNRVRRGGRLPRRTRRNSAGSTRIAPVARLRQVMLLHSSSFGSVRHGTLAVGTCSMPSSSARFRTWVVVVRGLQLLDNLPELVADQRSAYESRVPFSICVRALFDGGIGTYEGESDESAA